MIDVTIAGAGVALDRSLGSGHREVFPDELVEQPPRYEVGGIAAYLGGLARFSALREMHFNDAVLNGVAAAK